MAGKRKVRALIVHMTLEEVAEALGISPQHVQRVEQRAIRKLLALPAARVLREYL